MATGGTITVITIIGMRAPSASSPLRRGAGTEPAKGRLGGPFLTGQHCVQILLQRCGQAYPGWHEASGMQTSWQHCCGICTCKSPPSGGAGGGGGGITIIGTAGAMAGPEGITGISTR